MVIQSQQPAQSGDLVAEISDFLAPELQAVQRMLREIVESDSPLIRQVGDYVCLTSGKKLRPMMTLLAARAFGREAAAPVHVAAAMEAVHVATLLHDDVIDKANLRRGKPSVNAQWGDEVAILMADYLYASAFELTLHHLEPEPLRLICQITRRMCEGEVFQLEKRDARLSFDDYMYLITCKTAYLFSACGGLGAMCAGLSSDEVAKTTSFGLDFGLAFQITDDALDYVATDEQWGKPVGIDLVNGKQTLPLILALRDASPADRAQMEAILDGGRDLRPIVPYIEQYHSIQCALDIAREHSRKALGHLQGLTVVDRAAYDYLTALPEFVINRRY